MEHRQEHPLDIDLLDVVMGDLDDHLAARIAEHLDTCLLCRIRIGRIRRSGVEPLEPTVSPTYPIVPPAALAALDDSSRPEAISSGQVWLAGDTPRLVVWIRAVRTDTAIVHPVTFDLDATDNTSLIIDSLPRLGVGGAVVTSVVGTIPTARLLTYIGNLDIASEVDRLRQATSIGTVEPELHTGAAISGPSDERLEFRQLLADDLAALDVVDEDDGDELAGLAGSANEQARHIFELLRADLGVRRTKHCNVYLPKVYRVESFASSHGLVVVAEVEEVSCRILLITGAEPVTWVLGNADAACKLIHLAEVTALAVAEPTTPFETCLFEERHLRQAFEPPRAGPPAGPRLGWQPKPLLKAFYEYLEEASFPIDAIPQPLPAPVRPDLRPFLQIEATAAIRSLHSLGAQTEKRQALRGLTDADAAALSDALDGASGLDDVLADIERIVGT